MRIGQTDTGQRNVSASEAGSGLEGDKLSREATDLNFQNVIAKMLADAGPLAGKSFRTITIDSYEERSTGGRDRRCRRARSAGSEQETQ